MARPLDAETGEIVGNPATCPTNAKDGTDAPRPSVFLFSGARQPPRARRLSHPLASAPAHARHVDIEADQARAETARRMTVRERYVKLNVLKIDRIQPMPLRAGGDIAGDTQRLISSIRDA